jgi:hypothetical protein
MEFHDLLFPNNMLSAGHIHEGMDENLAFPDNLFLPAAEGHHTTKVSTFYSELFVTDFTLLSQKATATNVSTFYSQLLVAASTTRPAAHPASSSPLPHR